VVAEIAAQLLASDEITEGEADIVAFVLQRAQKRLDAESTQLDIC
jgi:hypothetical protein